MHVCVCVCVCVYGREIVKKPAAMLLILMPDSSALKLPAKFSDGEALSLIGVTSVA